MAGSAPSSHWLAGVFTPIELAVAAADKQGAARLGKPLFVQISDTHIGFNKDANPDVNGTLTRTIDLVNGMAEQPALIIHTGDITHLSKPAEFDMAQQMLSRLRTTELHTVPGEHDTTDPFGFRSTVDEVIQAIDLTGKHSIVTGGLRHKVSELSFGVGGCPYRPLTRYN
jgi:metallophosphoesterase superfamily enzyme